MTRKLKRLLLYMRLNYGYAWPPARKGQTRADRQVRAVYAKAGLVIGIPARTLASAIGFRPETISHWRAHRVSEASVANATQAALLGALTPLVDYSTQELLLELLRRENNVD